MAEIFNFCLTNWTFTDWAGNAHQFYQAQPTCNDNQLFVPAYKNHGSLRSAFDTVDGSYYHIDFSSSSQVVVTAKDGTRYQFPIHWDPWENVPSDRTAAQANNEPTYLSLHNMTMTDPNGNVVTVADVPNPGQTAATSWTVTDTLNRTILVGNSNISYKDDNGNQQNVALSPPAAGKNTPDPLSYGDLGCRYTGGVQPYGHTQIGSSAGKSSSTTTTQTLTLPVADGNHARTYTMTYDPAGHLSRIDYPSGGYTRYEYLNHFQTTNIGSSIECTADMFQVSAKYSCSSSSGSCSTEDTTTYSPTSILKSNSAPYNATISEQSPSGRTTTHTFGVLSGFNTSPVESDTVTQDGAGKTLRTVHTEYTQANPRFPQLSFPTSTQTTLNDSPSTSSFTVTRQFNAPVTLNGDSAVLDIPTEVDTTAFDGTTIATQSTTIKPPSAFTVPHILDRVDTQTTSDGVDGTSQTLTYTYDSLGNIKAKTRTADDGVTQSASYGDYTAGYPASSTDSNQNTTEYEYTDTFEPGPCVPSGNVGGYLTAVKLPNGNRTTYTYNACTGSLASMTDPNGNITRYLYDSLGRLTSAQLAGGFANRTTFSDGAPNTIARTVQADPNPAVVTTTTLDGLGRTSSVVTGTLEIDTNYDNEGRTHSVGNPKLAGSTGSKVTTYTYDVLDRVTQTTYPDDKSLSTRYYGEYQVVRDARGSAHVNTMDAQGRLTSVCEVTAATGANESTTSCPALQGEGDLSGFITSYVYNGKGDLTNVTARTQTRSFTYNGYGQLLTASNPETGTVCYGTLDEGGSCSSRYDGNGNLLVKTDARRQVTSYAYDSLNRMISKQQGGPDATAFYGLSSCYMYDAYPGASPTYAKGRLTAEWTQPSACPTPGLAPPSTVLTRKIIDAYDPIGRVLTQRSCTGSRCTRERQQSFSYDLAGNPITYDDGRTGKSFTLGFDSSGRLNTLQVQVNSTSNLFKMYEVKEFNPFGPSKSSFGGVINLQNTYDDRGRLTSGVATQTTQ